ncbi:MAG TPA: sigma-54-dependent Fis family transcriptional regulator [Halieaceae bacterium]|nr:sigma-54-dependent Fis family transcriptional regulator [Halieaceae bacterium]
MSAKTIGTQSKRAFRQLEERFVGVSAATSRVRELVARVSTTDTTVLIQGESGTGKEVVARLVHDLSNRASGPFIPINCGAIPGELLESELFGHEKGSFTGAIAARKGRFELAEGGTLFLDEIGDMPFTMQVKLLRVLQEKSYERVGGIKSISCDVRIIAATHQNLETKIEENLFRADLYYRLSIFPVEIPPLRERHGDIATLITAFLKSSKTEGRGSLEFSGGALAQLETYDWPGNVRELSNLIERLMVLYPNQLIGESELPARYRSAGSVDNLSGGDSPQLDLLEQRAVDELFAPIEPLQTDGSLSVLLDEPIDLKAKLAELEHDLIVAALEQTDWVTAHAANWLKLQRTTLVEKMRKHGIKQQH